MGLVGEALKSAFVHIDVHLLCEVDYERECAEPQS